MKAIALVLLPMGALFIGSCLMGCVVRLSDGGSAWIELSQRVEVGHNAVTTQADSTAELDVTPLVEHVIDLSAIGTNG